VKGNVLPCFEDFHQNHEMGNVHEMHLRDIWAGEKYQQFRKDLARGLRHKYEACKGCNRTEVLF
jgi:radical SAM protein with 4Fe4S-binding SPASM domain